MADRTILLDHLTRGRFMLGLGPGALPTDAAMIGIEPAEQRQALEEDTAVLMHLLRSDEPISDDDAALHARRRPLPAAPVHRPVLRDRHRRHRLTVRAAGRRPARRRLLSIGATLVGDLDLLAMHWDVAEERAAEFGTHRRPRRLAAGRPDAHRRDPRAGHRATSSTASTPGSTTCSTPPRRRSSIPLGDTLEERVAWVNESGVGVIGTPDDAINKIDGWTSSPTAASAAT